MGKVIAFPRLADALAEPAGFRPADAVRRRKQAKIREMSRQIRAAKKIGKPFRFDPNNTPSAA